MPPGPPNPDPISDQKMSLVFLTRFQTWPLKSIPVFRPGVGHKTQHTCSGAPDENIVQNHLNIALLSVFQYLNGRYRHIFIP